MIINGSVMRSASLIDATASTVVRDSNQRARAPQAQPALADPPAQPVLAGNVNKSDRVDLRALKIPDATYQQQRALSVYLATEVSSEDASLQPLVNIIA